MRDREVASPRGERGRKARSGMSRGPVRWFAAGGGECKMGDSMMGDSMLGRGRERQVGRCKGVEVGVPRAAEDTNLIAA